MTFSCKIAGRGPEREGRSPLKIAAESVLFINLSNIICSLSECASGDKCVIVLVRFKFKKGLMFLIKLIKRMHTTRFELVRGYPQQILSLPP